MKIWYEQPAEYWETALPLGNGSLGAMVYGGVGSEKIGLNHDTIWSGPGEYAFDKETPDKINEARGLLGRGMYTEATTYITDHVLLSRDECQSYQTAGFFHIDFALPEGAPTEYRRELSLGEGVYRQSFSVNGIVFSREAFVSYPDAVMCLRLSASRPMGLSFVTRFESPMPHFVPYSIDGTTAAARGRASSMNPGYSANARTDFNVLWDETSRNQPAVRYVNAVKAEVTGASAKVSVTDGEISVVGADSAVLFLGIGTSFAGLKTAPDTDFPRIERRLVKGLLEAAHRGYEELRKRHIADQGDLFSRVTLSLGERAQDAVPTDRRLAEGSIEDNSLVELLFQYGRYLLIASSRPGSEPANLQGIWNQYVHPPWGGRYTININTEMNYWPAQVCNLAECEEPFLRMVEDLSVSGQKTARTLFGARGWCANHNTDIWRWSGFVQFKPRHAFWPLAGAWLARNIRERYLFDGDIDYLRSQGLPILLGACRFMIDFLVEDQEGYLVVSPSTSPENGFIDPNTQKVAEVNQGSTVDQSIARELFETTLASIEVAGNRGLRSARESDSGVTINELKDALERLRSPGIGGHGQLLEFSGDFEEPEPAHRHVSHLYGVYPGSEFTPEKNSHLFDAARISLDRRGDKTTGWGMGWRVALWARFGDGDRARSVIANLLTLVDPKSGTQYSGGGGVYANLMDAHPPFQIDGNFGVTAGIAEMLLQSHLNSVDLLPALPTAWRDGSVSGLRARGGFEITIQWQNHCLTRCKVFSLLGQPLSLRYGSIIGRIETQVGKTYVFNQLLEVYE